MLVNGDVLFTHVRKYGFIAEDSAEFHVTALTSQAVLGTCSVLAFSKHFTGQLQATRASRSLH